MTTLRNWLFKVSDLYVSYDALFANHPVVSKVLLHQNECHIESDIYESSLSCAIKERVLYHIKDKMQTIRLTRSELKILTDVESKVNKLLIINIEEL